MDGVFRIVRFFSFLGLIVSMLGLIRRLPLVSTRTEPPRSPAPPPRATCGTELTVSVSTVIVWTDASAPGLLFAFKAVYAAEGASVLARVRCTEVLAGTVDRRLGSGPTAWLSPLSPELSTRPLRSATSSLPAGFVGGGARDASGSPRRRDGWLLSTAGVEGALLS